MYICGVRCDIFILVDKKYWPKEAQFSHLHRLAVSLFGDFEFLLSSNSTCSRLWLLVLMLKNTIIHRFYLTIWSPCLQDFSCWLIIVHTKSVFRLLDRRQKPVPIFFVFFLPVSVLQFCPFCANGHLCYYSLSKIFITVTGIIVLFSL